MSIYEDNYTGKHYRETFAYLASEVHKTLPPETEIFKRQKTGLIGWKLRGDRRAYFWLTAYNEIIYRLRTDLQIEARDLPQRFWSPDERFLGPYRQPVISTQPPYSAELSFHFSEANNVTGPELVRFVEDCFQYPEQRELIFQWPLFFASGKWHPDYAWSLLGKAEQTKREHTRHTEPRNYCPLCVLEHRVAEGSEI
jgi:hypothetical protein